MVYDIDERTVAGAISFEISVDGEFDRLNIEIQDKQNKTLVEKRLREKATQEKVEFSIDIPGEYKVLFEYRKVLDSDEYEWKEGKVHIIYINQCLLQGTK